MDSALPLPLRPPKPRSPIEIQPGAFHLPGYLDVEAQQKLLEDIVSMAAGPTSFAQPVLRSGNKMRLDMLCLGRHWNARMYRYEQVRSDVDGAPVLEIPPKWKALAANIAHAVGMRIDADIALINRYGIDGRLGLHQDKDESAETLAAGVPVVSISLGLSAQFQFGNPEDKRGAQTIVLASGDAFVFGGPSRLAYHGIKKVLPHTSPPELGTEERISITFRKY